jgi:hypothetical protein
MENWPKEGYSTEGIEGEVEVIEDQKEMLKQTTRLYTTLPRHDFNRRNRCGVDSSPTAEMPHFNHLSGPCFDLCWLRLSPSTTTPTTPSPEGSKEPALRCDDCVVLLPVGGGNKTKSGIANQIVLLLLHLILLFLTFLF